MHWHAVSSALSLLYFLLENRGDNQANFDIMYLKQSRLAYCELYVTIGTLFHRFANLEAYKTTTEDLVFDDFFSAYHIPGKNWLKAVSGEK